MARSGAATSSVVKTRGDSARDPSLSREQKLELYYYMAGTYDAIYSPPLEDYVLPQTSDIVLALRRLAAY